MGTGGQGWAAAAPGFGVLPRLGWNICVDMAGLLFTVLHLSSSILYSRFSIAAIVS